ncbi:RibD family protein [Halomonas sp. 18H]|nr:MULTISPECIES: RibD family protein [Halomonas]MCW4153040.1 RibD family protein [Halomonas sp. 18H]MDN3554269.1 RibD family protein [Halomonas almeriensis]
MSDSYAGACWQALLRARDHDWSSGPLRVALAPGQLTLHADGRWHAEPGLAGADAETLDALLPLLCPPTGCVIGQLGQSLDGRIATPSGHSHYINGLEARGHLHRLRALVDAVVVGAGTVAADDPALTVRHVEGPQPLRVVLDPAGRLGDHYCLFTDGQAPTWQLVGTHISKPAPLTGGRCERRAVLPRTNDHAFPEAVITHLRAAGYRRILIEGGSTTLSRFLDADALDRLHLLVAPLLIGSGKPGLELPAIETLESARRPPCRRFSLGDDSLFDLDLRAV